MSDLPTDDELRHWDSLVDRHVVNRSLPVIPSEQGQAVAELARAVPRLLRLIAVKRQDEAVWVNDINHAEQVPYIAWGGKRICKPAVVNLGYGIRDFPEGRGLRSALFAAAYGYVNGFPASAIAYYVLTRSLHWRISRWAMKREGFGWDDELRIPTVQLSAEACE